LSDKFICVYKMSLTQHHLFHFPNKSSVHFLLRKLTQCKRNIHLFWKNNKEWLKTIFNYLFWWLLNYFLTQTFSDIRQIGNTKIRTKQMSGGWIAQVVFKPLWDGSVLQLAQQFHQSCVVWHIILSEIFVWLCVHSGILPPFALA